MFARQLDESYSPILRHRLDALVWARMTSNACYRFSPPFIATIAAGFDVKVSTLGLALMFGEFAGLLSRFIGRAVDTRDRRITMTWGMLGVVVGVLCASVAINPIMFGMSVFLLSASKVLFDTSMVAWINEHVSYERRGRVIGIIETSWALGLLIGVAVMGLITLLTSWRIGFACGAFALLVTALVVMKQLPKETKVVGAVSAPRIRIRGRALFIVGASFMLMGASQCLGITFGPWLEDDFDGKGWITAVVVALGLIELIASITSAQRTDIWGKERSVVYGALLMVVSGLLLTIGQQHWLSGVILLVLFMGGFEFAIVSLLPIAANLVPGSTGASLGAVVGAGTLGRAAFSFLSTWSYESYGMWMPAVISVFLAAGAGCFTLLYRPSQSQSLITDNAG